MSNLSEEEIINKLEAIKVCGDKEIIYNFEAGTILNIIKKQNKETEEKETLYQKALNELVIADKMIDEMSKWISNESCREGFKDSMEEVKEIFRKKVEE